MAGQDANNLSSSSSHRLPTTSATESLTALSSNLQSSIPTGLEGLDAILNVRTSDVSDSLHIKGGVLKGNVTEVCGPPGVGKSSFALNVAVNALRANDSVVWVDTTKSIHGSRLMDFLSFNSTVDVTNSTPYDAQKGLDLFHHFAAPTLPHLLALLSHPTNGFPPPNTSLLVVDDLSALFSLFFRSATEKDNNQKTPGKVAQATQWASGRRWVVMDHLISNMAKLAATKNIAILLTSQMTTRIKDGARAQLCPAMMGNAWESGIATRIVLFRDWLSVPGEASGNEALQSVVRLAGSIKVQNISYEGLGRIVAFRITRDGLQEFPLDAVAFKAHTSSIISPPTLKRTYSEVNDSESEDGDNMASDREFGWDDEETRLEAQKLSK